MLNSMRKLGVFVLAASWLLILPSAVHAFDIIQITDNSDDDDFPAISGSSVVWEGCDGGAPPPFSACYGGDTEIYLWNGASITNISNNSTDVYAPDISGSNVVWYARDGSVANDYEIYFWDGVSVTQITDNSSIDYDPAISGSNVVWESSEGGDYEIYFWDGVSITQITDNSTPDYDPAISGSNVVWEGSDGNDWEIYLWDGVSITQITDNSSDDDYPALSGSSVVWQGSDGSDQEIYMAAIAGPVPLPSISFAGLALLAGLLLGIVAWASSRTFMKNPG